MKKKSSELLWSLIYYLLTEDGEKKLETGNHLSLIDTIPSQIITVKVREREKNRSRRRSWSHMNFG